MKARDHTQEFYTQRASFYERLLIDFLGWGRELESFFQDTDYIHPNLKILDAGCGTGIVTRVLYQFARENGYAGITFHAFDLTQNMLEIFREWTAGKGARNIELQQADVLELGTLPPHWKEYDLIVSSTMLEYLSKDRVAYALANIRNLLRNRGTLLVMLTRRNIVAQ